MRLVVSVCAAGSRGRSSAGRAPALHAGGHRFDSVRLHDSSSFKSQVWDGRVDAVSMSARALGYGSVLVKSNQGHVVDALAAGGDEGRRSLRKASGSGQARDDPGMSEWGNPAVG